MIETGRIGLRTSQPVNTNPQNDTPVRLDEEDAKFRAAVRRDIEQPDRGELIDHEEVVARMERLLQPR